MKSKLFATIALTAALSAGAMGMAACKPEENKTDVNPEIYAIYTAYAEEEGENALSYEEWYAQLLATAKGAKGDKGDKGAQGPAGTNGKNAYEIWLEQEGNEGKSVEEFLASLKGADGAQGPKGDKGEDGQNGTNGTNGTKWFTGTGAPKPAEGAEGDFYLDTQSFNLYLKDEFGWNMLGCIKGADGKDAGGSSPVAPTGNQVDIAADNEQPISVTLSEGMHIIEADLGETALTTGRLQAKVGDVISELVLSEARSTAAGGNKIYYGYVNIKADTSEITIMAKSEAVKATIAFKDWTVPTIKEDEPIEMPIYPNGTSKDNITPIQFDESFLDGKYKVKLNAAEISSGVDVYLDSAMNIFFAPGKYMADTNILTKKGHKTFYLMEMNPKQGDHVINPAIVTFTAN